MSSHKRVKDVTYDGDNVDGFDEGYDDDEEFSAEDAVQMQHATVSVKERLNPQVSVTDKEIRDALWYYYYDVEKTVQYLQRSQISTTPKKPKEPSRFDQAANAALSKTAGQGQMKTYHQEPGHAPFTPHDFFRDTPWLNVPEYRRGIISIQVHKTVYGLLGGSSSAGKPSKLAALAAARRKAQQEKKDIERIEENHREQTLPVRNLEESSENSAQQSDAHTESKAPTLDQLPSSKTSERRHYPKRAQTQVDVPDLNLESSRKASVQNSLPSLSREYVLGTPSAFANTILGKASAFEPTSVVEGLDFGPYLRCNANDDYDPFAELSPDDIVIRAQAKGTKKTKSEQKSEDETNGNIAEQVAAVKLDDRTKTRSKNLDVADEFKRSNLKPAANFVVIGHVDHGKSTLMGRLLYDLKIVNQRSVDKLRSEASNAGKSSFALAWVMDSTSEERQRGVTVDIATNNFETTRTRFTILDAPGHRDFIPNMIAGASQADFAVLVIDASPNAFESGLRGQTKEHALLVRSMGITRIIIAVNKMDVAKWSKERFNEISQQMAAFLTSAGFQPKNCSYIPCAGLTGENVVAKVTDVAASWYTGLTLVDELDASEPASRAISGPLRMAIADVFRGGVQNPLSVSGRIESGSLQIGDAILAMPAHETASIKGVEVESEPVDWAVAGQIATFHLSDIDPIHLRPGDVICSPIDRPIGIIQAFTAKVLAFEHIMPGAIDVHKGRMHVPAKVSQLLAILDKTTGDVTKKKPRVVQPGAVARVRIELENALPLEGSARVVLRAEGQTIAAGLVENVFS